MSADATTDDISLLARAACLKPEARSPLRRWMARHADELTPSLTRLARPNWQAMATEIRERGIQDGRGRPPTARTVRDTWRKVAAGNDGLSRPRQPVSG
jgi:hypothetical protein